MGLSPHFILIERRVINSFAHRHASVSWATSFDTVTNLLLCYALLLNEFPLASLCVAVLNECCISLSIADLVELDEACNACVGY